MEKKIKKIRRFAPCSICDIERLESWLTDMAAQGWHLKEIVFRLHLFVFEAGEPQTVRYRLEPGKRWDDDDKPEYTAQEFFKDCGWEAVGSYGRSFIFRTAAADAPELNTDPAVHLLSIKWLRRKVIAENITNICITMGLLALLRFSGFQYIVAKGVWIVMFLLGIVAIAIVNGLADVMRTNIFVKQLKSNQPLDHNKPWRKKALYYQTTTAVGAAAWLLFYGIWIGSFLVSCGNLTTDAVAEDQPYQGDPPIVTMADLCADSGFTLEEADDTPSWSEITNSGGYTLEWMEGCTWSDPTGESSYGYIWVIYHETSAEWIARGLAEEYLRDAQREDGYQERELPPLDADFAAAYGNTVILREGNVVIKARIPLGNEDGYLLTLWIEKMMEKLK